MYKRRIRDWGWRTYELDKDSGNSGGEPSTGKPRKRTRGKVLGPPSTLREENSQSNSSRGTTVAVFTPPLPPHTHFNPTHFSMGIPTRMSNTDFDELLSTILDKVKDLYISYPAQKKWKVEKQREVEEDEHDDLLVGVATSIRNCSSLSPKLGYTASRKLFTRWKRLSGPEKAPTADYSPYQQSGYPSCV